MIASLGGRKGWELLRLREVTAQQGSDVVVGVLYTICRSVGGEEGGSATKE